MEVTLSPERAKSRTRGRKRHLTGAKARVGRAHKIRADLEQQLKACRREIAHARERLAEVMKQQTATSEMMRIISSSPIQSVLDAVAENAARLCEANNAEIFRLENNLLHLVASYGEISVNIRAREGLPATRDRVIGRATCDRRTIQVRDLAAEENEFPVGSSDAKRAGHRTTLATPLLREGAPIGVILMRRWEVRPFSAKQIALLENFADQAVIAIENARLFEAEKQRSLALAQANRDLAEREAKIRRLVDANIIGIFIWEMEGRVIEANDAFLRMIGYDRADLASGRVHRKNLTPSEWSNRDEQTVTELKTLGTVSPFEKEYYRKDGSRVPVLIGLSRFEEGGNEGVAFVVDLRERKQAEEVLRESEYKARQIIETVPGLLWSTGPDGEPTQLNQRILDYSGMPFEDFLQFACKELVHPDDFPETANAFFHAIRAGTPYQAVNRLRRADGEYRWHHTRGEPLRDQDGRIIQWYGLSVDVDELKKAEDRLRHSEAYLAEAQRLNHTGSFGWKPDSGEIVWSDETYRIFEYDPAVKPTIDSVVQRVLPYDRALVQQVFDRASQTGTDFEHEYRLLLADGRVKHVHAIARALRDASGNREFIGAVSDITERKTTEEQLRRSAQELQRSEFYLTEGQRLGQAGSWALNPSGFFEYWSRELFQIYGLDPQMGAPTLEQYLSTIHPEDRDFMAETIKSMCEQGSGCDAKKRIIRPDGAVRYIRCVGIPVLDNGVLKRFLGTAMDVTEQEQLTQELRRREAYLAEAQRLSQTGSWAWSPDSDIRYWSEECYRVLSFDPQDGLPRFEEFFQRIHPDDQPGFRKLVQTAIREKAEWETDYRIVHLDGLVRDIHVVGHPVLSTSGHLVEFVGTVIDVTERRRAEQERARLRQLEADLAHINRVSTLGEMAASLAHEITQPFATARNNASAALNFLDKKPPALGEVREALDCIVNDADRAGAIIGRIRDHIKKAPPRKDRFDVNEAINEVIVLARGEITKNGVSVDTHLKEGALPVEGDRVQLQQVLLNLILNAVEAMGSVQAGPRELSVCTEQSHANGVLVVVRDSGPGIDAEHFERVFETFYTTKSGGVGMGLSICRSIIDAHGGRLWTDANDPRGAVFQFTLPSVQNEFMNSATRWA
jgi:PAS domain S-box-containing protein